MNDAQHITWKALLKQHEAGKIHNLSYEEGGLSGAFKVLLDGKECQLLPDGQIRTDVVKIRGGTVTTSEVEFAISPAMMDAKLGKALRAVMKDSDKAKLEFDRIHFSFKVFGKLYWRPGDE